MSAFVKNVQNTASYYKLWTHGSKIIIGVSGGPDSICLLDVLVKLGKKYDWQLRIAHINYRLRGQDSDKDELLVRSLAKHYGIPVHVLHPNLTTDQGNLETYLRDIRYRFFESLRRRYAFDVIAVAHNMDDQAETVLLRLIRGSGLSGLRSMRPKNNTLIRPFLHTSRKQIMTYIENEKLLYRIDQSNEDIRFLRNNVRHRLLPYLEQNFNPSIKKTLAKTVSIIADDYDVLLSFLESQPIPFHIKNHTLSFLASDFLKLHPSLQKLLLRHFFEKVQNDMLSIEESHTKEVIKMIQSTKSKNKTVTFGRLKIIRKGDTVTVTLA